ncbi:hypothetical protein GQ53DRAFT_850026 [Thozetella sp. PMI_491]|nr:hypothetical protein GQ53DRAFT_850026 [Thozetella sp. PMI_491]
MPVGASAEPRVHSPWKRSACDRCRSQKLRCLRQQDDTTASAPCLRCIRCRASCFTSSAKPLGRPCKAAARARQRDHAPTPTDLGDQAPRSYATALSRAESPSAARTVTAMEGCPPPPDQLALYECFLAPDAGLLDGCMPLVPLPPTSLGSPLATFAAAPAPRDADADPGVLLAALYHDLCRQLWLIRAVPWEVAALASSGPTRLGPDAAGAAGFNPLAAAAASTAAFLDVTRRLRGPDDDVLSSLGGDLLRGAQNSPPLPLSPSLSSPSLGPSHASPLLARPLFDSPPLRGLLSPPAPSSSPGPTTAEAGPVQLLALLSCYLQAVAVYDAILTRVLVGLARAPNADGLLCGGPAYFFFGVPGQGRLLLHLLLQVVHREVALVEGALGLPREYCVVAPAFPGPGLLGGPEGRALLATLVGCTVDGGDGRGGLRLVASLRDNMRRIQRAL